MRKIFNLLCVNFGFGDSSDFFSSLIHYKLIPLTLTLTGLGVFLESYLGLSSVTLFAFGCLIILELATGIIASRLKGQKIESRKFARFGLKFFVWIILFFIITSMKNQYSDGSNLVFKFYDWLHTFILGFVNLEYLISVIENAGVISGKSTSTIVTAIKKKFGQIFGVDIEEEEEKPKDK